MKPMKTRTVLYAAVGAPVVAARKLGDRFTEIRASLSKEADNLGKTTNERINVWANEGEKVVNRISEGKMVDELAAKVDFDQVSEQVSKLRDQLEDLLGTWRASFRPEKTTPKATVTTTVKAETTTKPAATASAKTTSAKTASAKTASAKKTPANKNVAKKAPASKNAAKKTAAKKTASASKAAPRAAAQQAS
jgi:hypothetical protein